MFKINFQTPSSKCFFDGGSRKKNPCQSCVMFMLDGGIFCASWADVSATSLVSQIALLLPAVQSEALTFRSAAVFRVD